MRGISASRQSMAGGNPESESKLIFEEDALNDLVTHKLASRIELNRVFFQLPAAEPGNPTILHGHSILDIISSVPGVFAVKMIRAAKLLNTRDGVTCMYDPDLYRNPTYVANLSQPRGDFHPMILWRLIYGIVDAAYEPDAILCGRETDAAAEALGPTKYQLIYDPR